MSDIRGLIHALSYPTSNDAYHRDQQALTDLYKQPGFFLALQQLAADKSLSPNERLLASVITGRELKTKWRSKHLVPEQAKPAARELLFSFLSDDNLAVARPQLSLLVAVARIEYPRVFPNLPQLLLDPLSSSIQQLHAHASSSTASTILLNTLWTINALVKEWRTVKVAAGQEAMRALEEAFVPPIQQVLDMWAEREQHGGADWVLGEAGRYAFKTLARFSQWHWAKSQGIQDPAGIQRIHRLVQQSVIHAPLLQSHRIAVLQQGPPKLLHGLLKHLRAIGKWWRTMIDIDAKRFCAIEGVTSGIGWWWSEVGGVVAGSDGAIDAQDDDAISHPKSLLLLGMLLFKDILPILAVQHLDIFTPDFVLSAFHLLIDKLLPLTTNDLERLEDEPEEWLIGEDNDEEAWKFEFRPCAERVLMALNNACRHLPKEQKVIEPEMIKILHEAEAVPPNDLRAILRREAVYCALGRLARSMSTHGGVDFNAFLQHNSSWLSQGVALHRILKRRLAWLIGHWVGADEECAKLPLVWEILVHMITERGESSDMAVRLTAAVAIKEGVDLWELDIEYFVPYLERTASELVKLLGEAGTLSGKRYINETLVVVIERVQDKILPYLPALAQAVPTLWHGAIGLEGEWLFKASLVVLTTKLVSVAKDSAGGLMDLVLPLIQESLVPPAKEFFEEDGITLWQTGLHNVVSPYQPTAETGLIKLFPGLLGLLVTNADLLESLLRLLDSYIMLDPSGILQTYGSTICAHLYTNLSSLKPASDPAKRILRTVSLLIRSVPVPALAPLLLDSGLFQFSIKALEDDKAAGLVLAAHLEILGRTALSDANVFLQMVAEAARREGKDGHKVLEEVLDTMWRNFDYVGDREGRKTVAMGMANLLTTGNQQCFERLEGEMINMFLDVLGELFENPDVPETAETMTQTINKDESLTLFTSLEGTAELSRRVQHRLHDPVYVTPFKGYLIDCLTRAQGVGMGPYWEKTDEGTRRSLEKFLSS